MTTTQSQYGNCPVCGSPGISRERRPDGNDKCSNGHLYKSSASITRAAPMSEAELELEAEELCIYEMMGPDDTHKLMHKDEAINLAKKYRGES